VVTKDSGALALNFAPGRWLFINADIDMTSQAIDAGAVVFDAEGKWRIFQAQGQRARCAIAAALDLDSILRGRECAAVTLFDVPAIIARIGTEDEWWVCVHASYAEHFMASIMSGWAIIA
jgi:sarcosine oxidase gamma subunit